MSRRITLAFLLISMPLFACNCVRRPGQFNPNNPPKNEEAPIVKVDPPPFKEVKLEKPIAVAPVKPSEPEPVFTFKRIALPERKFNPITTSVESTVADKVKVELLAASIDEGARRTLNIKLLITNEGRAPIPYSPWHAGEGKKAIPHATDESGNSFSPLTPSSGKPLALPVKIESEQSVIDYIAFAAPKPTSQEVDFKLPGANIQLYTRTFAFKIGREFFAKAEDERLAKQDEQSQLAAFKIEHAAWAKRVAAAKQKAIDDAAADAERERLAKIAKQEAEQKAERDRIEAIAAAKRQAIEDAKPRVRRENYNKVKQGMTLKEVQDILGPGKEAAQSGGIQIATWEGRTGFRATIISMTFRNGILEAKSILD